MSSVVASQPIRKGPSAPQVGFGALFSEMKAFKKSMLSMMTELTELRAENRALSSDVRKLMKNQDYNFDDLRQEMATLKEALGVDGSGAYVAQDYGNGGGFEPQQSISPLPEDEAEDNVSLQSKSDVVDITTIMGGGDILPSTRVPLKNELEQRDLPNAVKQEDQGEGEEGMYTDPTMFTSTSDYPGPSCSSDYDTSVYLATGLNHSMSPSEGIAQGPNYSQNAGGTNEHGEQPRKRGWSQANKYEEWARLEQQKWNHYKETGATRSSSYCFKCRTMRAYSRCIIPSDPRKLEIFVKCALKTMSREEIDAIMATKKKSSAVCEWHVPGFREKIRELSKVYPRYHNKPRVPQNTQNVSSTQPEQMVGEDGQHTEE